MKNTDPYIYLNGASAFAVWPKLPLIQKDFVQEHAPLFLNDMHYQYEQANKFMNVILQNLGLYGKYTAFAVPFYELHKFLTLFFMISKKQQVDYSFALPSDTYAPSHNVYKATLVDSGSTAVPELSKTEVQKVTKGHPKNQQANKILIAPFYSYVSGNILTNDLIEKTKAKLLIRDISQVIPWLALVNNINNLENQAEKQEILAEIPEHLPTTLQQEGWFLLDSAMLGVGGNVLLLFIPNSQIAPEFFEFWESLRNQANFYSQIDKAHWITDWMSNMSALQQVYIIKEFLSEIVVPNLQELTLTRLKKMENFYDFLHDILGTNEPLYLRPQGIKNSLYGVSLKLPKHFATRIYKDLLNNYIYTSIFYKDANSVYLNFTPVMFQPKLKFDEVMEVLDSVL